MPEKYILAIDQGTTQSSALLFNEDGRAVSSASREVPQIFPRPGWVEHDPEALFSTSIESAKEALEKVGVSLREVSGVGITNQRETTVVWERVTGKPVCNAIVWQCRRTAPLCEELITKGLGDFIREKTGLIIDAYFSATKLRWILDNIPDGQKRAENGELLFGTVDSWLVWKLTGGKVHITDYSNACRTMLFNIHTLQWDTDILNMLDIPQSLLPAVKPSSHIYGETNFGFSGDVSVPICSVVGDQPAALFGQACYETGMAKNTYGTGSFILLNSGDKPVSSEKGLVSSIAWVLPEVVRYALEGSIFVTGAAVQWLRDGPGLIKEAGESEALALSVPDTGGVYFVPALTGLGAPHWDMHARGTITGITRGASRDHLVRATLEAIAYQTRDVVDAMLNDTGLEIPVLRVDGGGTANGFLMQFQADILGIPVQKSAVPETTALGAAFLAGLANGTWQSTDDIYLYWSAAQTYEPGMSVDERETLYSGWKRALEQARSR